MRTMALAKNEELFRKVNERIESLSQVVAPRDQTMEYLCECDRAHCYERIKASREEYKSVRAVATHFIVLAGHEDRRIERVAFSNERFLTIEKQGAAALDAVETDPRN
jgi:hypothetical protein